MMRGSVRILTVLAVEESRAIVQAVNTTYNSTVVYMYFIYGKVCEYYILDTKYSGCLSKQQTLSESVIMQNRANRAKSLVNK
jgi:hypothetical protein